MPFDENDLPPEVVAELREARDLKSLTNELWNDKDHGLTFKRLVKAKRPNSRVPEIDIAEPLVASLTAKLDDQAKAHQALLDKIAKDDKAAEDRRAERDLIAAIDGAQRKYRLSDEGRDQMIAHMKAAGSADALGAAAFVASNQPAPAAIAATGLMPSDMNLFGAGQVSDDETIQLLHQNPGKWADMQMQALMSDPEFLEHPERF